MAYEHGSGMTKGSRVSQRAWHSYTPYPDIPDDNIQDNIISRWDITITPKDFKAVMRLVTPPYRHAMHTLSFLPSTEVSHRANANRDAFSSLWATNLHVHRY